jgi:hypothetical protein
MAQQTAIKILLEYIEQRIYKVNQLDDGTYLDENIYLSLPKDEFEKIKDKAKAMEKEQIMESRNNGIVSTLKGYSISNEDYYNETYNK